MSKVSVIVPVYNCEQYVERCLLSLINQDGATIEIIVVNDGSTDGTLDILKKYEDKIILETIENGGVANARNVALEKVTGDFVLFVDADDYLEEGTIKKLIQKQSECNADVVRFRYKKVYSSGQSDIPEYQPNFEKHFNKSEFKENVYPYFIKGIILNSVCLSMFKYDVVKDIRFRQDMKVAEDAIFCLNAFTKAKSVLFLPDAFYNYYSTKNSLTGNSIKVVKKYMDNYKFAFETIKKLKEWEMNNLYYIFRSLLRPILLTVDKMRRMKKVKEAESEKV